MLKKSRSLPLSLGLLVAIAGILAALTAESAPPDPSATTASSASASAAPSSSDSASGSPSASASGTKSTKAEIEAALPALRGADIPTEPSDAPKEKDWTEGKQVRALRELGGPCRFTVIREWLRIVCEPRLGGTLVSGDSTDVKIAATQGPIWGLGDAPPLRRMVFLTFRLKRGESKIFNILKFGGSEFGYGPPFVDEAENIAVVWRPGHEDPVILVSAPRSDF